MSIYNEIIFILWNIVSCSFLNDLLRCQTVWRRMIGWLEMLWKWRLWSQWKVLTWHLPGLTGEDHEKLH